MLTVAEVLPGKVTLDIECVDRVLLNGYIKQLPLPGGVVNFIREQKGRAIPSPVMLNTMTTAFRSSTSPRARVRKPWRKRRRRSSRARAGWC